MALCEWQFDRFQQAIDTATRAAELCEVSDNAEGVAHAYMVLGWSYYYSDEYEKVLALEPAVERARERRLNLTSYTYSLSAMSLACRALGRFKRATEFADKGFRIAEEFADASTTSFALWVMAYCYALQGDSRRALEAAERSVHVATPAERSWAEGALGVAHCRAGNAEQAVEIHARYLPLYRAAHYIPSEEATPFLGEAYWRAGEYEKGRAVLEELLRIIEPYGMRLSVAVAHRILGEIAAKTDPARAPSHFDRSIALLLEIKAEPELALAYAGYGRFHKQQGRIAEARDYLTRALAIFERLGTLGEPETVRRELVELPTK